MKSVVLKDSCSSELLKIYLELKYHYNGFEPSKPLIDEIIQFQKRLPQKDWCNLFTEKMHVVFSVI
jgi:hypothetical protein